MEQQQLKLETGDTSQKEIAYEIGKHLAWELMESNTNVNNLGSYLRSIVRKNNLGCGWRRKSPSKDLVVRYGINSNGWINSVWWLLEQLDKGNVTIKDESPEQE